MFVTRKSSAASSGKIAMRRPVIGIIGNSTMYIGQVVYIQQGTAGNMPFAAAFSLVPILIIAAYLAIAKRLGAFDAL